MILNHIYKLSKRFPNDSEFGEEVRKFVNSKKTCCFYKKNQGVYTDEKGREFKQCKKCGKILGEINE